jgi:drug/metabolite transporter (DMT)-like permease
MPIEYKVSGNKKLALVSEALLLLAAMTWGGEYVVAKIALDNISPLWLNTFRFGAGWIFLMIVLHRQIRLIKIAHIKAGFFAGIFMFGGFATQLISLQYTTAGNAAFLTTTYVVMIPIYVWIIYRRRPSGYVLVAGLLCIIGAALLSLQGNFTLRPGDGLVIFSAAMFAADICTVEYYIKRGMDPLVLTICQMGFVAGFSLSTALLFEPMPTYVSIGVVYAIIYMVLLGAVFTQLVFNIAMKHTTSTKAAIITASEAVFAFVFAIIFIGDLATLRNVLGGASIVLAVIIAETELAFLRDMRKRKPALGK